MRKNRKLRQKGIHWHPLHKSPPLPGAQASPWEEGILGWGTGLLVELTKM